MSDERLRIPIHPEYTAAIGVAVYCFASLEWNAVWCCERIEAGSIDSLDERTAGRVADTLIHLIKPLADSPEKTALEHAAADFRFLVGTRNNLVHAKPGLAPDGTQGLFRHGDYWTVSELESVADAFAECSMRLNRAVHAIQPATRP